MNALNSWIDHYGFITGVSAGGVLAVGALLRNKLGGHAKDDR